MNKQLYYKFLLAVRANFLYHRPMCLYYVIFTNKGNFMTPFGFFLVLAMIGGYIHARIQMRTVHRHPNLGIPRSDNMISFLLDNK